MSWPRLFSLLLLAAGLAVYLNSFRGAFVFDDEPAIVQDAAVRDPLHHWRELVFGRRATVRLSLAANYVLHGLATPGYHAVNLAIHLAAGLTLYGIARRTLRRPPWADRFGEAWPWLAFAIALLWLVHPLQTQAVTYIIQRAESLMGLLYLFTIYATIRVAEAQEAEPHSTPARAVAWSVAAVTACVAGMATKEVMVTAPLLAWLYDRTFLAGSFRGAFRRRGWLYAGLALTWAMIPAMGGVGELADAEASAGLNLAVLRPWQYLFAQSGVILHYLRLCVWPHPLVLDYLWPLPLPGDRLFTIPWRGEEIVFPRSALLPSLVIVGLLAGTAWALVRRPWLGFLGAWFFLILGPTSSFLPIGDLMMEHRMYLPLAAVVALAVGAGYGLCLRRGGSPLAGLALLGLLALALGLTTAARNDDYRSPVALWLDNVTHRPFSFRAHNNLAAACYDMAVSPDPRASDRAVRDLSKVYYLLPSPDPAERRRTLLELAASEFEHSLRLNPDDWQAHTALGEVYADSGQLDRALDEFRRAARLSPREPRIPYKTGVVLLRQRRPAEAEPFLRQAIELGPANDRPYADLAVALAAQGKDPPAVEAARAALSRNPANPQAQALLRALGGSGRPGNAN